MQEELLKQEDHEANSDVYRRGFPFPCSFHRNYCTHLADCSLDWEATSRVDRAVHTLLLKRLLAFS